MIKEKKQKYFHFPLGGILTKKIISGKIKNLLENIKSENENDKNVDENNNDSGKNGIKNAIHLDLTESVETSLINEFLFSFLITKFYTNNETIIYIPKDIDIYIEIPNCFNDYLSQFGILSIFYKENISLDNKPKLELSNNIINIFDKMVGLNSNEKIEKDFLQKYMDKQKKYSYHQIIIFLKLFISQYNKFDSKLTFYKTINGNQKDVTEKCICDFAKSTKYFINNEFQNLLMEKIDKEDLKKKNKDYIDLLSEKYNNDLEGKKFDIPLIFIIKEKMSYEPLKIEKIISNPKNSSKEYLSYIKNILNLPNEIEEGKKGKKSLLSILSYQTDNYVITNDNFTKMVLLVYRIIADIPVILMGETGCGKTALIIKLSQILNNGEKVIEIINIHPGITDKYLCKKMEEMNKIAEDNKGKELWVFFDEINTCLSLSLLTEIFVNKTFNGKKLNDKIRLIGACNPYRRREKEMERCGYGRENINDKELVYSVQPLPQSLLNYVFSFGSLNKDDEKKYIYSIIEKLFVEGEEKLHEATKDVIFNCHKFLRDKFDTSVVSLREISRFSKIVEFFQKYFSIKRKCEEKEDDNIIENNRKKWYKQKSEKANNNKAIEKIDKIISLICSVYL